MEEWCLLWVITHKNNLFSVFLMSWKEYYRLKHWKREKITIIENNLSIIDNLKRSQSARNKADVA